MGLNSILKRLVSKKQEPKSISQIEREQFVKDARSEMMMSNIVKKENEDFLYGN